jgi:outer membrane protein TolC
LLKERCDLLGEAVRLLSAQWKRGTVDFSRIAQAERDYLKATLDLHDSPNERLAALKKVKQIAEDLVAVTEARFKAGTATAIDLHQARAELLKIRIELLRAEKKGESSKKRP